jgi:hypothetical protein
MKLDWRRLHVRVGKGKEKGEKQGVGFANFLGKK